MPNYAVYYVPPADSDLYQFGTQINGYDVRNREFISPYNNARAALPDFHPNYVARPSTFGIHATIFSGPKCRTGDIPSMVYDIEAILNSFASFTDFRLSAHEEFVTFWGLNQQIVVLRYKANRALSMLHALLVAKLSNYAIDSHAHRALSQNAERFPDNEAYRLKHFHYSHIFDGFNPHVTLLHPYTGNQYDALGEVLGNMFANTHAITLENICLMIKDDGAKQWRIHKEFVRSDYPQPYEG